MKIKIIFIFLIVIGLICITINITRSSIKCPTEQITYRYIPRSFEEEQEEPVFVTDVFKTMFSRPGVWEAGLGARSEGDEKKEQINKFFISQS